MRRHRCICWYALQVEYVCTFFWAEVQERRTVSLEHLCLLCQIGLEAGTSLGSYHNCLGSRDQESHPPTHPGHGQGTERTWSGAT